MGLAKLKSSEFIFFHISLSNKEAIVVHLLASAPLLKALVDLSQHIAIIIYDIFNFPSSPSEGLGEMINHSQRTGGLQKQSKKNLVP